MAAPNIAALGTVTGKTAMAAVTTSNAALINNPADSGKVLKVNSIIVANVDGTNAASITVRVFSEDDLGGTGYALASTINVPADSSIVILGKDSAIFLEENMSIGVQASADNDLEAVASYEEVSE
jgi:hypothetical protein